jgi:hypothetical protein
MWRWNIHVALCREVEGEEEVIQANILVTEVAMVAGFVE